MFIRRLRRILTLAFPVILFAYAIYRLFMLRFDHGDFYPAYSSLRADPLGTRILYESLERLPGFELSRHYALLHQEPPEGALTLIYAGASLDDRNAMLVQYEDALERFVREGGRLVLSFQPTMHVPDLEEELGQEKAFRDRIRDLAGTRYEELKEVPAAYRRQGLWDVRFGYAVLPYLSKIEIDKVSGEKIPVSWHTTLYFKDFGEPWQVLLSRGNEQYPVLLERAWAAGSVVLASDSYFLSNEAMIAERHTGLINHLLGDNRRVIFDESHHAIVQRRGVSSLIVEYRLHGAVGCLLLLAGLFVWKNSLSLVPPHPSTLPGGNLVESDKDASEGFRNLLRRNIAPARIIELCFSEWERSCLKSRRHRALRDADKKYERMKQLALSGEAATRPVETYRKIADSLNARD